MSEETDMKSGGGGERFKKEFGFCKGNDVEHLTIWSQVVCLCSSVELFSPTPCSSLGLICDIGQGMWSPCVSFGKNGITTYYFFREKL